MILPAVLVIFFGLATALYVYLRRRPSRGRLWRAALGIGLVVGVCRAVLASLGWYILEHTGGFLQIPAYALAMAAWPEAAIFAERRFTPAPAEAYLYLLLVLVAGTVAVVGVVAAVADLTRVD
jgi:hypothetical protein